MVKKKDFDQYRKEYDALTDEEKVKRLEVLCQHYCAWLNTEQPNYVLDCTKFWPEFEEK